MHSSWLHQTSSISWATTQHWGLGMCSFIRSVRTSISKCRLLYHTYEYTGTYFILCLLRNLRSSFYILWMQESKGMKFVGGESAALGRVNEYFWKKARGIFMLYMCVCIYIYIVMLKMSNRGKWLFI